MKITMRAMRVNRGLTQEQIAKMLGVTKATVINWEKGKALLTHRHSLRCVLFMVVAQTILFCLKN